MQSPPEPLLVKLPSAAKHHNSPWRNARLGMTPSAIVALGIRRQNLSYYVRTGQAVFTAPPKLSVPRETRPNGTMARDCLTCGDQFWSWGPGNRMCGRCRLL